jgi:hypothetical protein
MLSVAIAKMQERRGIMPLENAPDQWQFVVPEACRESPCSHSYTTEIEEATAIIDELLDGELS